MSLKLFLHSAVLAMIVVFLVKLAGHADEIGRNRCLMRLPKILQNAFVPPFNCSLCEGLEEIPWIFSNESERYSHW